MLCIIFSSCYMCQINKRVTFMTHTWTLDTSFRLHTYLWKYNNEIVFFSSSHSCFTEFVVWIVKILQNDNLQTHRRKEISTYMNSYIQIHYKCNNNLNFDVSNIQEYTHTYFQTCVSVYVMWITKMYFQYSRHINVFC